MTDQWTHKSGHVRFVFIFLFTIISALAYSDDILYIGPDEQDSTEWRLVSFAADFYGLSLDRLSAPRISESFLISKLVDPSLDAVIISVQPCKFFNTISIVKTIRDRRPNLALLFVGITPSVDSALLSAISHGVIIGCDNIPEQFNYSYLVADIEEIAKELSGQVFSNFKYFSPREYSLRLKDNSTGKSIIALIHDSENLNPIFVVDAIRKNTFFLAGLNVESATERSNSWQFAWERFFEIAPLLMFLRYAAGDQCWHNHANYANLTIDDPWLTNPYGNLNYFALLKEMEKQKFHTTIAFIPWNFERSRKDVVSLFKRARTEYSICFHGNNHDHKEFDLDNIDQHEADIAQAVERMKAFEHLTGLAVDRVMVFPHSISPSQTFEILKRYGFLATVNAQKTPMNAKTPDDPYYELRSVTLSFESMPSVIRYPAKQLQMASTSTVPLFITDPNHIQLRVAANFFLDNPVLFYTHQSFFQGNIAAFNEIAKLVNVIGKRVTWRSLGDIAKGLYLSRLRNDGDVDIRVFSNTIILGNDSQHTTRFYVKKEESYNTPIQSVIVDNRTFRYEKELKNISLTITLEPGQSKEVRFEYENQHVFSNIDIAPIGSRLFLIRVLSDFRDLFLSRSKIGAYLVERSYSLGLFKLKELPSILRKLKKEYIHQ